MNNLHNKLKGVIGEKMAVDYLLNHGCKILEQNFHYSRFCEIDIIAKEKDTLVFVEVKTRTTRDYGDPLEAITRQKLNRIYKAALFYMQQTQEKYKDYRIDIITLVGSKSYTLEHLKNISLF